MSAHGAPVRSTQSTPLSTSRGSRQGRPPLGVVRICSGSGRKPRTTSHCSSVRSIPTVDHKRDLPSIPSGEVMKCALAAGLPDFDAEALIPDPDHVAGLQLDGLLRPYAQEYAGCTLAEVDERRGAVLRQADLRVPRREERIVPEVHVTARPPDRDRRGRAVAGATGLSSA